MFIICLIHTYSALSVAHYYYHKGHFIKNENHDVRFVLAQKSRLFFVSCEWNIKILLYFVQKLFRYWENVVDYWFNYYQQPQPTASTLLLLLFWYFVIFNIMNEQQTINLWIHVRHSLNSWPHDSWLIIGCHRSEEIKSIFYYR